MHHPIAQAPVQEVHRWYFILPHFPDTEHSTASDPASRNVIFHVFGVSDFFFLSPPATKRGRHSKAELSCKAGTEEQVLTISPVFSVAPTLAATLHFSCN